MSKIEGEKKKTMLLKTMEGNTRKISKRVESAHCRKRQKAGAEGSKSRPFIISLVVPFDV